MSQVKKINLTIIIIDLSFILLVGCNNKTLSNNTSTNHAIKTIKQGNDIVINSNDITRSATYYNYEIDDYNIQLFAVKGDDEIVRIVFNTCSSCNPSPMAYFIQKGNHFECQNCKNKFHRDEIGLARTFGCSPIAILDENKTIEGDNIIVSSSFIETYKNKFETINIFEN